MNYHRTKVNETKEDIIKTSSSTSSKTIDFNHTNKIHCELCQKDWKKWKSFQNHITKCHSGIYPLRIKGHCETIVKFDYRKKSNKYACEACQKDWDSMNDLEKHLGKNHPGDQGELKIDVSYGKTIITFVVKILSSKRDENSTFLEPLNVPMDVNDQGEENELDIEGVKKVCARKSTVIHNDNKILDFVKEIEFSDYTKPKFEVKGETLKVESSGIDLKLNMPNDMEKIHFVHDIEFSDDIKPKLDIKEEPIDKKSSLDGIKRKSEFMEEALNVKRSKIDQKPDIVNSMVPNNKETIDLVPDIEFSDDTKPKLDIKEEPMSMESSSASTQAKKRRKQILTPKTGDQLSNAYGCPSCNATFASIIDLKNHITAVHESKTYNVQIEIPTVHERNEPLNEIEVHEGKKYLKCHFDNCDYTAVQTWKSCKMMMLQHIRAVHGGEKEDLSCHYINCDYTSKGQLISK